MLISIANFSAVEPRPGQGDLFRTDQGNIILDSRFGPIAAPEALASQLEGRAGIAAHGLFLGLATDLVVAGEDGVRHIERSPRQATP